MRWTLPELDAASMRRIHARCRKHGTRLKNKCAQKCVAAHSRILQTSAMAANSCLNVGGIARNQPTDSRPTHLPLRCCDACRGCSPLRAVKGGGKHERDVEGQAQAEKRAVCGTGGIRCEVDGKGGQPEEELQRWVQVMRAEVLDRLEHHNSLSVFLSATTLFARWQGA